VSATRARGLFVTGTDTGVGKTVVSVALLRALAAAQLRAVGMKPVAAGIDEGERESADVAALAAASSIDAPREAVNPYAFRAAIAPHVAAAMAGQRIELAVLEAAYVRLASLADAVIVEGAGGALVPLDERADMLDIARACGLPVLLVVGMRLGCINHALLSAQAIRARGLVLAGWIATRIDPAMTCAAESVQAIGARIAAPLLGDFGSAADVAFDAAVLARLALAHARAAPGPCIDPC
jgi:dethiobiotin synthetase